MKYVRFGIVLACFSLILCGCTNANTTATPDEERAFRNPPKSPPPEAMEAMKRGMANRGK